jgi:hypothetical protein
MARSQLTIANRALDIVGASNIVSINQNSKSARKIKNAYDPILEDLLFKHNWSFAIKRIQLAQLSDAPLFGYTHAYQLPSDYIRLIECNPPNLQHKVEAGNTLLIDSNSCQIRYVSKITDPNAFTPEFAELFAKTLAAQVAYSITQSRTKEADLEDKAVKYFRWATSNDSKASGSAQKPQDDVWMISRGYDFQQGGNAIVDNSFDYGQVN